MVWTNRIDKTFEVLATVLVEVEVEVEGIKQTLLPAVGFIKLFDTHARKRYPTSDSPNEQYGACAAAY
ncbi:hypothetical protein GQ457_06G015790 [Hibiscus cannabinus]